MKLTIEEHIKELRKQFIWLLLPIVLIFIVSFIMSPFIINNIINYLNLNINVVTLNPFEGINTALIVAGVLTIILSIPFILYSLFQFSKSTFNKEIKKKVLINILIILMLAVFGILFGIFVFSKMVLNTLLNYNIANPMWSVSSIIKFIMMSGLIMAFIMQITIILPTLNKMGFINIIKLKESRWLMIIGTLIVSAIITPPDIISQIFVFIPFYGSIELGMLFCKKRRQ